MPSLPSPARALVRGLSTSFALATILAGAPSAADDGELPRFGEVVDVRLVSIELLATDGDGNPVHDLRAEEVRVFEQDRPVEVERLELLTGDGAATTAPDAAPGTAPVGTTAVTPPLHLAVFIDEVHVGAASRRRLLLGLADALQQQLRPQDRVMVALYNGNTRIAMPFSTDRKALTELLDEVDTVSPHRLLADQDRSTTMDLIYEDANVAGGRAEGCLFIDDYVDGYSEREFDRVSRAVGAFGRFVDSLAGIEGRKVVLHVSDGIPMRAGAEIAEYGYLMCSGMGAAQGLAGATDVKVIDPGLTDRYNPAQSTLDTVRYDTSSMWEAVTARANAGNVSVYAFQVGIPPGAGAGTEAKSAVPQSTPGLQLIQSANLQDTLFLLADRTGGRLFRAGGDPLRAVSEAVAELREYYQLTYVPPAGDTLGVRHIRVETTRPGVELRYRKLYSPRTVHEQIADQLLGRLLYGSSEPPSGLGLDIGARQPAADARVKARFRLQVPIGMLTLPEQGQVRQGLFTVFVVVGDDLGGTSPVRQALVPVRVPLAASPQPEAFVWEVEMLLAAGRQQLAVAVRDEISGEIAFLVRDFEL